MLQGASSADAEQDLAKLTNLLSETEASMRDEDFCLEHIGPIEWLLEDIETLYSDGAHIRLLDPAEGPALRTKMVDILCKWKEE
mmetsp:Transcript_102741/g.299690  ORF Transcript_102741/g.299690 Transcript_102741/m.299690 type:complete len:84 (-) Transcript_102741:353-604(-)